MANEVATRQKTGIATYLANDKVKNQITSLVGEKATPTFISSVVSAVQTNPALAECSNSSIFAAARISAVSDLIVCSRSRRDIRLKFFSMSVRFEDISRTS